MNHTPIVSVLMTIYNREKYIADAIESVLNSTYKHWELIIVDDGSNDKSLEIARSYEVKDARIQVFRNAKNLGDYANRNKAASYAKGKYLKYVDGDDLIYPHGLEIMVGMMEKFPEAGWGLMSLAQDNERIYPFSLEPKEIYRFNYFKQMIFHKAPLSSIIKKEVFDQAGGFQNVRHFGDYDLWHRLALFSPLVLMPQGMVWWRKHQDQENQKRKSNPLIGIYTINSAIKSINSNSCPLNNQEKEIIQKKLRNNKLNQIRKQIISLKLKNAVVMIKNFNSIFNLKG
jgi:glycosyltransferase involved in cell wall biosynthesis